MHPASSFPSYYWAESSCDCGNWSSDSGPRSLGWVLKMAEQQDGKIWIPDDCGGTIPSGTANLVFSLY